MRTGLINKIFEDDFDIKKRWFINALKYFKNK